MQNKYKCWSCPYYQHDEDIVTGELYNYCEKTTLESFDPSEIVIINNECYLKGEE